MIHLILLSLSLILTLDTSDDKQVKIEFHRVENSPADGLIEANDPYNSSRKIYLHKKIELDNKDIASAIPDYNPQSREFSVHLAFTEAGAKKMSSLSKQLISKRLAILLDGNVISAPLVTAEISKNALIDKLSKDDAERIAKAFSGK